MSKRKKKNNKKLLSNKMFLIVCFISTLLIVLLLIFGISRFNQKNYYEVDSRVGRIAENNKFLNTNYDQIGWLRVQGTKIDLPVLYGESYTEPFPMDQESFVWTENSDKKFHNMEKIVGHNLYNLSKSPKLDSKYFNRFEQLMSFVYYDFAKDNKYIQYTIDGKDYIYKIFAVGFLPESSKYRFPIDDDYSKSQMKNQIKVFKDVSLYDYNVDVNENDKLISLSTCTRMFSKDENYEFYVVGRLVRDGEKINNYKVVKNKSYNKVEKILEGDENEEKDSI